VIIESKWNEPGLINEFSLINENEKDLPNALIYWNPKILIKNSINESKQVNFRAIREPIESRYETQYSYVNASQDLINDGHNWSKENSLFSYWIVEYQSIKGWFFEKLELNYFPVDVQDLSIILTSSRTKREVVFNEMKTRLSSVENNTLDKHIWHLYQHVDVNSNYDGITDDPDHSKSFSKEQLRNTVTTTIANRGGCDSGSGGLFSRKRESPRFLTKNEEFKKKETLNHPFILFQCRAARKSGYYYWNCFFLTFLLTSVVFTTFSIDVDKPFFRLPTTSTLLLTSVTFRWVYSGKCLPTVNYLTSLDKYALISLTCIYLCLIWHGGISQILIKFDHDLSRIRLLDKFVFITLLSFYIAIHFCLIFWLRKAHRIRRKMLERDTRYHQKMYELYAIEEIEQQKQQQQYQDQDECITNEQYLISIAKTNTNTPPDLKLILETNA
jgi:hypothetical protein